MDADKRRLERGWLASGNVLDRIRVLREEIRRGQIPRQDALKFLLRDRHATYAMVGAEEAPDAVENWIELLAGISYDDVVRASIVGARLVLPGWRLFRRNDDPEEVFGTLERSLSPEAPSPDFSQLRDRFPPKMRSRRSSRRSWPSLRVDRIGASSSASRSRLSVLSHSSTFRP